MREVAGPPIINPVDITPFQTVNPANKIRFASQTAASTNTARIPQDLSSFIAAGTITQQFLDNPNKLLRDVLAKQNVIKTTAVIVSTAPTPPLFGGGVDNIAFLLGQAAATAPNAQALQMAAIFWIETVETTIIVGPLNVGQQFAVKATPSIPVSACSDVLGNSTF